MIAEVYDALISAGADDRKARRAAEVLTEFDDKFDRVERRIDGVERRIDLLETNMNGRSAIVEARIATSEATVTGKINLISWLLGLLVAAVSALVIRAFA